MAPAAVLQGAGGAYFDDSLGSTWVRAIMPPPPEAGRNLRGPGMARSGDADDDGGDLRGELHTAPGDDQLAVVGVSADYNGLGVVDGSNHCTDDGVGTLPVVDLQPASVGAYV